MALEKGFTQKWPDRAGPKSAAGFEWPNTYRVTDEQRMAFRKWFTSQLRARGLNHRTFAIQFWGATKNSAGYVTPRAGNMPLEWMDGGAWPREDKARQLGAFFKVPMEAMLVDDGKPLEPIPLVRPARATAKRRKANGNGTNGHAAAHANGGSPELLLAAPLPPRPAGAALPTVHVEALKDSPDYCRVTITGVVRYDTAMGIINIVGRDSMGHAHGPRHK